MTRQTRRRTGAVLFWVGLALCVGSLLNKPAAYDFASPAWWGDFTTQLLKVALVAVGGAMWLRARKG